MSFRKQSIALLVAVACCVLLLCGTPSVAQAPIIVIPNHLEVEIFDFSVFSQADEQIGFGLVFRPIFPNYQTIVNASCEASSEYSNNALISASFFEFNEFICIAVLTTSIDDVLFERAGLNLTISGVLVIDPGNFPDSSSLSAPYRESNVTELLVIDNTLQVFSPYAALELIKQQDYFFTYVGEIVNVTYMVVNTGAANLSDVNIDSYPCQPSDLSPGDEAFCTVPVLITEENYIQGNNDSVTFDATAYGNANGPYIFSYPVSSNTIDDILYDVGLLVEILDVDPSTFYFDGEPINITYRVTNIGKFNLTDLDADISQTSGISISAITFLTNLLLPGESITASGTIDIRDDSFNTKAATLLVSVDANVEIPVSSSIVSITSSNSTTILYSGNLIDLNVPPFYVVGTLGTITLYDIIVSNPNNVTLENIQVDVFFQGSRQSEIAQCPSTTLEPGSSMMCEIEELGGNPHFMVVFVLSGQYTDALGQNITLPTVTKTVEGYEVDLHMTVMWLNGQEPPSQTEGFTFVGEQLPVAIVITPKLVVTNATALHIIEAHNITVDNLVAIYKIDAEAPNLCDLPRSILIGQSMTLICNVVTTSTSNHMVGFEEFSNIGPNPVLSDSPKAVPTLFMEYIPTGFTMISLALESITVTDTTATFTYFINDTNFLGSLLLDVFPSLTIDNQVFTLNSSSCLHLVNSTSSDNAFQFQTMNFTCTFSFPIMCATSITVIAVLESVPNIDISYETVYQTLETTYVLNQTNPICLPSLSSSSTGAFESSSTGLMESSSGSMESSSTQLSSTSSPSSSSSILSSSTSSPSSSSSIQSSSASVTSSSSGSARSSSSSSSSGSAQSSSTSILSSSGSLESSSSISSSSTGLSSSSSSSSSSSTGSLVCPPGYMNQDGTCIVFNECLAFEGICGPDLICVSIPGSHLCVACAFTVQGVVVSETTGLPLSGASVFYNDGNGDLQMVFTNSLGQFTIVETSTNSDCSNVNNDPLCDIIYATLPGYLAGFACLVSNQTTVTISLRLECDCEDGDAWYVVANWPTGATHTCNDSVALGLNVAFDQDGYYCLVNEVEPQCGSAFWNGNNASSLVRTEVITIEQPRQTNYFVSISAIVSSIASGLISSLCTASDLESIYGIPLSVHIFASRFNGVVFPLSEYDTTLVLDEFFYETCDCKHADSVWGIDWAPLCLDGELGLLTSQSIDQFISPLTPHICSIFVQEYI